MAKGRLFNRLRDAFDNVQQNNRENPNQKTAPNQLFRRLQNQLENMAELQQDKREQRIEARQERQENRQERREQRRELKDEFRAQKNEMKQEWQDKKPPIQPSMTGGNLWDSLRHQMNQAKADNEQRQDEPTADANVWEQLMGEIQKLEAQPTGQVQSQPQQQRQQPQQPQSAQPTEARHNPWAPSGAAPIAQGVIISDGSVNLRAQPNMAAPRSDFRIQSGAVVNLVGEDKSNPVNLDGNVCGWCKVSVDGVEGWIPDAYLGSA